MVKGCVIFGSNVPIISAKHQHQNQNKNKIKIMASRFQKKSAPKLPAIAGTRPSLFNYQLLTGTGIPGLDQLLGGGLPLGTVTLLEDLPHPHDQEESGNNYSTLIIKYFLAEGVFFGHDIYIGNPSSESIQLPAIISGGGAPKNEVFGSSNINKPENTETSDGDKMKIAWRYENQAPKGNELTTGKPTGNHHFNLNKTLGQEELEKLVTKWTLNSNLSLEKDLLNNQDYYQDLFNHVQKSIEPFVIDPKIPGSKILRIGLFDCIGSILMSSDSQNDFVSLTTFLYKLKSLARTHYILIMLSLSRDFFVHNEVNGCLHRRIKEIVDFVLDFTSFGRIERQTGAFKDHHGILTLAKAAPLNCLQNSANVGHMKSKHLFKSLRTKFSIERMHLPPELGGEDEVKTASKLNKLDF